MPVQGWDSVVASTIGMVSDLLAALVIVSGFVVLRPAWVWFMLGSNRHRAFRHLGKGNPSLHRHVKRAQEISRGVSQCPQEELAWWLTAPNDQSDASPQLLDLLRRRPAQSADPVGVSLAKGYEALVSALNSRLLFGAGVPVVIDQASLARRTADYLAQLTPVFRGELEAVELGHDAPDALSVHRVAARQLISFHAFPGQYVGHHAFELVSVFTPELLSAPYPGSPVGEGFARHRQLDLSPPEAHALEVLFRSEHIFDGILPRLTRLSSTRDKVSGHRLLVAELSATTYGAVIAEHYPGDAQVHRLAASPEGLLGHGVRLTDVDGTDCGLVTLSLAPVTRDGYVVFTQRSTAAGSHEGKIGPGVNGNLEINRQRERAPSDVDSNGAPDPLAALARESHEELGLHIKPGDIDCLGLVTFSATTEQGTHCLVTSCRLGVTLEEVAAGLHEASTLEGRWEVGWRMLGMRLPSGNERGMLEQYRARARWLLTDERLTPHAVAAGLSVLVTHGQGGDIPVTLAELVNADESPARASRRLSFSKLRRRHDSPEWLLAVQL